MFYLKYPYELDVRVLSCTSFIETERAKFPEVDYYDFVSKEEALRRLGRGLRLWIENNCKISNT
jgi:hypothetical protein